MGKGASAGSWVINPSILTRLEQLIRLSQRTDFIQELLALPVKDRAVVKRYIKTLSAQMGIEYNPPRGVGGGPQRKHYFTAKVRLGLSVLMGIMVAGGGGSALSLSEEGDGLVPDHIIDRLINAFHLYLQLNRATPSTSDVTFELFVNSWRELQMGTADLELCGNCGSMHYIPHVLAAQVCPSCSQLNLALLPKQIQHKTERVRPNPVQNPEPQRLKTAQ